MKKNYRIILIVVVTVIAVILFPVFWPRHYPGPKMQPRQGTAYWQLPTGSMIAYTFLPGEGPKQPYPIIYLHGGPGAGITAKEVSVYRNIARAGYDVYLYDQVGCGHSSRLADINAYTAMRQERDLDAIVKKTGAAKVILAGQSWGSILAVMYVTQHPEMVHRVVITAPAPIQPSDKSLESLQPPDSLQLRAPYLSNRMANEKTANERSKAMYYFARHGIRLVDDREADEFAVYLTGELNKSMVCDTAKAVPAEGTEGMYVQYMTVRSLGKLPDPRPVLKKLNIPVLVMKAQCDNQPWGYTAEYLKLLPRHQFVFVRNAGHNIFLEQPELYVDAIVSFLKQK